FQWTAGFGFSAGFIDYFLSLSIPIANQPYMLIVQGLAFAVIYYFLFRFLIIKFNLKTPGREDDDEVKTEVTSPDNKFAVMAATIFAGLGGTKNVTSAEHCATRLRVEVKNMDLVDQMKIKSSGIHGINVVGPKSIQVIVGTNVQFVADEVDKLRK
ncbi:MAG: glucose PTS transporter subunit EIIB, partial [Psychrobacillus sp.]